MSLNDEDLPLSRHISVGWWNGFLSELFLWPPIPWCLCTPLPIFCPLGGTAKVVNAIIPHFSHSGCRRECRFIPPKLKHLIKMPELGAWYPVFSRDTTFSQGLLKWWLSPCCPSLVFLQLFFGQRCLFVPVFFLVACWAVGWLDVSRSAPTLSYISSTMMSQPTAGGYSNGGLYVWEDANYKETKEAFGNVMLKLGVIQTLSRSQVFKVYTLTWGKGKRKQRV